MKRFTLVAAVGAAGLMSIPASAVTLYDNGAPDGSNGYSNGTPNVFGGLGRRLLDDFTVPAGESWGLQDFHWHHVWDTLPAGSGVSAEITLWTDSGGQPGVPFQPLSITSYNEMGTGQTFFSRPEAESWVEFDEVQLGSGTYWFEATIVGPENNFWLINSGAIQGAECWVNYDDFSGLISGTAQFGVPANLTFSLTGRVIPAPSALALLGVVGLAGRRRRR